MWSMLPRAGEGEVWSMLPRAGEGEVWSMLPRDGEGEVWSVLPWANQCHSGTFVALTHTVEGCYLEKLQK